MVTNEKVKDLWQGRSRLGLHNQDEQPCPVKLKNTFVRVAALPRSHTLYTVNFMLTAPRR
jgi:hypothetical protein